MKNIITFTIISIFLLSFVASVSVNADYVTIYPGEEKRVNVEVDNTNNFDIDEVNIQIVLNQMLDNGQVLSLPFAINGASSKEIDDEIDEGKDDEVFFDIIATADATPGDYSIPYIVSYVNYDNSSEKYEKQGTFNLRVSAKTDLDFAVEARGEGGSHAIVGNKGEITLEIINRGLGDIKAVSVEVINPNGYELLSKDKIFLGTVDSDDSDNVNFDCIFRKTNGVFSAKITYKDFENNEEIKIVSLPIFAYSREKATELGLISQSKTGIYIFLVLILIIIWFIWRKLRKKKKRNN